jgi:hypothetical protein
VGTIDVIYKTIAPQNGHHNSQLGFCLESGDRENDGLEVTGDLEGSLEGTLVGEALALLNARYNDIADAGYL